MRLSSLFEAIRVSSASLPIEQIAPDEPLEHDYAGASPNEAAISSLRRYGIAVLRNAFDPVAVDNLAAAAQSYVSLVRSHVESGDFCSFDPKYNLYEATYAADWVAVDPATADQPNNLQLHETELFKAVVGGPLGRLIERVVSFRASWQMARIRLILPEQFNAKTGKLDFHQEKTVTPFAGLHNLWLPLVPRPQVTNRDTPGLQFYVGERDRLINRQGSEEVEAENQKLLKQADAAALGKAECPGSGFIYRPELRLGDAVIFDAFVPHASYIPPGAAHPRVSFDVRLFPTPYDRGPKEFPLHLQV